MKRTPKERLTRAVNRLIKASIEYSWRGFHHPDDHPCLERDLISAQAHYNKIVDEVLHYEEGIVEEFQT